MEIDALVFLFNLVPRKLCSAMGATRSKILDLPHGLFLCMRQLLDQLYHNKETAVEFLCYTQIRKSQSNFPTCHTKLQFYIK